MAGITLLEKNSVQVNYIINQFFRPELHQKFFDDSWGLTELSLHFYDPRTVIYGIMEQGKPTPIGIVYFLGVVPYRDCTVSAVIFDEANRNQDKVTGLIEKVKTDFTKRFSPHSVSSYIIGENPVSQHILEKLGFTKIGVRPRWIYAGGDYKDVSMYYLLLEDKT